MNVDYYNRPPVRLENLDDTQLESAIQKHVVDLIPDVLSVDIRREKETLVMGLVGPGNRHDRRRQAATDRRGT